MKYMDFKFYLLTLLNSYTLNVKVVDLRREEAILSCTDIAHNNFNIKKYAYDYRERKYNRTEY